MTLPTLRRVVLLFFAGLIVFAPGRVALPAEEGDEKPYKDPQVERTVRSYERDSRDVVQKLDEIVAACELKPGMDIADVGAGTGLFTRPFAAKVAPGGKVYAVEIAKNFVEYIEHSCRRQGIGNVVGVLSTATSAELPPASVDVVFLCDTYHHFDQPEKMLASIHRALRPGGRLVVVDYKKEEGVSPKWIFGHVRADKKTAAGEIVAAGFKQIDELDVMKIHSPA